MPEYRRSKAPGASFFFTVNCLRRKDSMLLVDQIDTLKLVFREVRNRHPFTIDAMVVLPDHLHCIWTLPDNDNDFAKRWTLIKAGFSRNVHNNNEVVSVSRSNRGERGIWQRRYWEHKIRDDLDFERHTDYIHWNPVKHGYCENVADWPYSSFHRYVSRGVYSAEWGSEPVVDFPVGERIESDAN